MKVLSLHKTEDLVTKKVEYFKYVTMFVPISKKEWEELDKQYRYVPKVAYFIREKK